MELVNNSTIETVIDFANVKFGMELTKDEVSEQLRNLSFSQTLKLVNSIKADDNDAFADIIDLSAVSESWYTLPTMDKEKYQERDGLEGPIMTKSGKVVYYDPKEGKYYDPDTDIYLTHDEWKQLDEDQQLNEWVFLPWLLPALATAARVGGPALFKLLKHGKNAAGKVKVPAGNAAQAIVKNPGTTLSWVGGGYVFKSVYDVVEKVKEAVGDFMDEASIESFAQLVWKYKLPVAAVVAVLYGGKKLKDYMAGEEEEAGNTTINNYYGTDSEPATEDTNRLRKLAGITEKTSDVYTTELGNVTAHSLTMHGLLDQIEDYYHNKHDSDEMDIQIGDDTVWLGDEQFSIEKNGEELGSDLGNELEREDISKGNGPYQHKLQGDDLERSKTMTPDEIKVLAGVTEEELNEYGTIDTARPSRATARADRTHYKVSSRRANNIAQDQNRDASVPNRTVAGGNKQPTGQGAARAGSADPDDIERAHNANVSSSNQEQANVNAQEIERLKQLAMGG